jgi:hypothetical protein
MNASVTPIVAGELAHGAFQHGFESYGVDILRRVAELGKRSGGTLHCSYTGAFPPPPPRTFIPLDLTPLANMDAALLDSPEAPDWRRGEHPDLCDLPKGEQVFAGVPFRVPEGPRAAIGLSRRAGYAPQVELPVHTRAAAIYILTRAGAHCGRGRRRHHAALCGRHFPHPICVGGPACVADQSLDLSRAAL